MNFDFLFSLRHHILEFSLNLIVGDCNLSKSKLIVLSEVQPVLHLPCQSFPGVFKQISQILSFLRMVGIGVLHLVLETVKICLIEFADFNFGEFNLSLVVFHDIFDFVFKFIIVFLDELQPFLLVLLQVAVDAQNSLGLGLFGVNHILQNVDFVLIELP